MHSKLFRVFTVKNAKFEVAGGAGHDIGDASDWLFLGQILNFFNP